MELPSLSISLGSGASGEAGNEKRFRELCLHVGVPCKEVSVAISYKIGFSCRWIS